MKRKIAATALITALVLTAPGLPCYQALAGMNIVPGKSGPSAMAPGALPAAVTPNAQPVGPIGGLSAPSAPDLAQPQAPIEDLAVPLNSAVLGSPTPIAESALEPTQGPEKKYAHGNNAQATSPQKNGAHALHDASTLAGLSDQRPFFDVTRLSQKEDAIVEATVESGRAGTDLHEPVVQDRQGLSAPPKPEINRPKLRWFQFSLRGFLVHGVLSVALASNAWNAYTSRPNPYLAEGVETDMMYIAPNAKLRDYETAQDFPFFMEGMRDLHEHIQNSYKPAAYSHGSDALYYPYRPGVIQAVWSIRMDPRTSSEEGVKELYEDHLKEIKYLDLADRKVTFQEFQAIVRLHQIFSRTRKDLPHDRPGRQKSVEEAYFDYLKIMVPLNSAVDAPRMDNNAKKAFAALRAEETGHRDFHANIAAMGAVALVWLIYFLRGPMNIFSVKPTRRLGAWLARRIAAGGAFARKRSQFSLYSMIIAMTAVCFGLVIGQNYMREKAELEQAARWKQTWNQRKMDKMSSSLSQLPEASYPSTEEKKFSYYMIWVRHLSFQAAYILAEDQLLPSQLPWRYDAIPNEPFMLETIGKNPPPTREELDAMAGYWNNSDPYHHEPINPDDLKVAFAAKDFYEKTREDRALWENPDEMVLRFNEEVLSKFLLPTDAKARADFNRKERAFFEALRTYESRKKIFPFKYAFFSALATLSLFTRAIFRGLFRYKPSRAKSSAQAGK